VLVILLILGNILKMIMNANLVMFAKFSGIRS